MFIEISNIMLQTDKDYSSKRKRKFRENDIFSKIWKYEKVVKGKSAQRYYSIFIYRVFTLVRQ